MDKLLLTLGIIFVSLVVGYAFQGYVRSGKTSLTLEDLTALRLRMQKFALFVLLPVSAMLSLWGLPTLDTRLLALPLLGLCAWIWGGMLGVWLAGRMKLSRAQTGTMYCCGTFTNIGAVGSLVCVVFLGENTIAIAAMYRLCEELYYFSVAYPVSRWYGMGEEGERFSLRGMTIDPILKVVISALLLGIGLNMLDVPRPEVCGTVASGSMILATISFLMAIGMSLRLSSLGNYTRQVAGIAAIKFFGAPVVVTGLAWIAGLGEIDGGMPLRVVAVLSSMPVAMNALVPPSLFNLDLDMANACWIGTTAGLVFVLPVLLLLLPLL